MWQVTTPDFREFTEAEIFLDPGYSVIDAHLIEDPARERWVMVVKDERPGHKYLRMSTAPTPNGPWTEPSEPIAEFGTEGASSLTFDGHTLVLFDQYHQEFYGAFVTSDFRQRFRLDFALSFPERVRHGTILRLSPERFAALDGLASDS